MTCVLAVNDALSAFVFPFILTQGGPLHRTETLTSYAVWQSFQNYRRGYGAAIAVFHFAIAISRDAADPPAGAAGAGRARRYEKGTTEQLGIDTNRRGFWARSELRSIGGMARPEEEAADPWRRCVYGFLTLWALAAAYPLVFMLITSLKKDAELYRSPFALPEKFRWDNFVDAWVQGHLGPCVINSIEVTLISLVVGLGLWVMCAFAFARLNFGPLKTFFWTYVMFGFLVPDSVGSSR